VSNKNAIIRKSNWLITASYRLTLNEQRLVLAAIAKIPFKQTIPDKIVLTAKEFLDCFPDIGERNVYKEMEKALENLSQRWINVEDPEQTEKFRWIDLKTKYHKGSARIGFAFSRYIIPYLQQLKEQFTKYKLGDISGLKSTHSIRIYEMLMQFHHTGILLIDIQEFKERLGIQEKYADYRILRRKLIEPSVSELNQKSHFNVTFKAIREGRSIQKLEFFFSEKQ
jgi:plasmid replication initiation protein